MYRNEDKKAVADKWQGWANVFQFGTLALVFVAILILNNLSKEDARAIVWYIAGFLFLCATAGFLLGRKALHYRMIYLNAERDRVSSLFDSAIEKLTGKKAK